METEIELKFFVSSDFSKTLKSKILETKVLQHSCRQLGNTYFDTEDHWLREHDIGMRIRRYDDVFVQTVKTAGRVIAGLHQRPEYNAEHTSDEPDLGLHPQDIWPQGRDLDTLASQIKPIFSTDFQREQWLVSMPDGTQIEVAFDQGEVRAGDLTDPICEVELELKSGQTDTLFTLARQLSNEGGMRLGNLSKAARGYRLAFGYEEELAQSFDSIQTKPEHSVEDCLIISLEKALSHWHYHEQLYTDQDSDQALEALKQINYSVGFIRQLLQTYRSLIPKRATAILRQELSWLEDELDWLTNYDCYQDLIENKGHVLRKLDGQKFLVAQISEKVENLPSREQMLTMFHGARYTGLLLDLSRWILSRGWQPFLDEKGRQKMSGELKAFASKRLASAWAKLIEVFPPERVMSRQDYLEQREVLSHNLYTGLAFSSLFDNDSRMKFRLPWVDLLQGVDDLFTLVILEEILPQLNEDEQLQLERWLQRQEMSLLHAMEQTRAVCIEQEPYWEH